METGNFSKNDIGSVTEVRAKDNLIRVKVIMACPNADYKKSFKNKFNRGNIEFLTTSLKIFDWMTCPRCGELLNLYLNFEV